MLTAGELGVTEAPDFVARCGSRWWQVPLGADQPVEVGFDHLLARMGSPLAVPGWATVPLDLPATPWQAHGLDEHSLPTIVLRVGAGVLVAGSQRGPLELTADDLLALEAMTRGEPPTGSTADIEASTARLEAVGLLPPSDAAVPHRVLPRGVRLADKHPIDTTEDRSPARLSGALDDGLAPGDRVPVYSAWHAHIGPMLSLGMLTAAARHHADGSLDECYEIRRPEPVEAVLADLASRQGPAILLCSNYVWSLESNLEFARRAREINPELIVLHGGPSSPKYEGDADAFFAEHAQIVQVLVRGEGEVTLCALLEALAEPGGRIRDLGVLADVEGLSFRDPRTGALVRTPDRARTAELDALPSPYLTGEFDHLTASCWPFGVTVETNRGCPFGCTFCDWGAATMSRIRKFDVERVFAELEWVTSLGAMAIYIADANFGILERDVAIATHLCESKERTGTPEAVIYCPAKNTTRHLPKIIDQFSRASISTIAAVALQSTDATTLEALNRSNISFEAYIGVAADHRRRGHVVQGELLLGAPGQTYASFREDLQFMFDHEILVRSWPVQVLPNAPMNDPAYRERFAIEHDEHSMVISTSSFTAEDRARMLRLRTAFAMFEGFGLLRHVLRWVQWDHGTPATAVIERMLDASPEQYPHLRWVLDYFDVLGTAPVGWGPFYDDVGRFLVDTFGVERTSAFRCVLAVNQFLMPAPARTFPQTLVTDHDYVAYHRDATTELYRSGEAAEPPMPLGSYGAGHLTVTGDPLGLCRHGLHFNGDSRDLVMMGDFHIGAAAANELLSPLARLLPDMARHLQPDEVEALLVERRDDSWSTEEPSLAGVAVGLGRANPTD